jgi:hypothetical protein
MPDVGKNMLQMFLVFYVMLTYIKKEEIPLHTLVQRWLEEV